MEPRKKDPEMKVSPTASLQREASQAALAYIFGQEPSEGGHRTTFASVATMVDSIITSLLEQGIKFPKWEVHRATLDYAESTIFLLSGVHNTDKSKHLARRVFDITPADIQSLVDRLFAEVYSRRRLELQESAPDEHERQVAALPLERQFVLHGLIGLGLFERELRGQLKNKQGDADELLDQLAVVSESYADELGKARLSGEESELVQAIISKRVQAHEDDQDFLGRLAMRADAVPDDEFLRKLEKERLEKDKEE